MKIEQLIVQHLYNNKSVTLQDIGSFILSPSVSMPTESNKDGVMPENAISFEYNTKATEDEALIDFIVQQTRKIKPLASSDLESYTILGREYLNIGKPFPIEGLGTLQKNQSGQYEFIQGNSVNPRLQAAPALLKEKDDEQISFSTPARKPENTKKTMLVIGLVLVVVAAIVFALLHKSSPNQTAMLVTTDTSRAADTSALTSPVTDSSRFTSPVNKDSASGFKIIIREYSTRAAADNALARFSGYGHPLSVYQSDSTHFQIVMPFSRPLSDTSITKDSLVKIFGPKTHVAL